MSLVSLIDCQEAPTSRWAGMTKEKEVFTWGFYQKSCGSPWKGGWVIVRKRKAAVVSSTLTWWLALYLELWHRRGTPFSTLQLLIPQKCYFAYFPTLMSSVCFANSHCSNSYKSIRLDLGYLHEHLDADSYLGSCLKQILTSGTPPFPQKPGKYLSS